MSKSVAIIGSGPSGLACAETLKEAGLNATIYDELIEFGGMLAYGIPEFRIPLKNVKERITAMQKKGILFKREKIVSIRKLLRENGGEYDFVVIAIGAGKGMNAGFEGEKNAKVIDALDFLLKTKLENKRLISKEEKIVVIGGGNSAMDASRVAIRHEANVKIIYRRTENEMPALKSELNAAKKEGVKIILLTAPKKFDEKNKILVCRKMVLGENDETGRKKPVDSGNEEILPCDKIIVAAGQKNDYSWIEKEGIKTNQKVIIVNENNETSLKNIYACGDCITGPKTIGEATKTGVITAKSILKIMQK
jgi:NADPH-dependent glutamate synthase beta subunit-like oxidoreductase